MKRFLIVGLLLGAAAFARADEWYVNYQRAKDALQAHQWQRAVDLLNEAVNDKDESSKRVKTYGMQFIPYFPYIYRGAAYFNLNNRPAAKADLEREENNEASGEDKALLQQYLDQLQKAAAPQVPPAIAEQKKPEPDQSKRDQKESKEPERRPSETKTTKTAPQSSESNVQPSRQNAQQASKEAAPPPSTTPATTRIDTAGQGLLAAAKASLDSGNLRRAKAQILDLRRSAGASEETTRMLALIGSSEERVRKGAGLFFEGKYADAAAELSGASNRWRDNPHAFALLACSYAAQYLLGGSSDSGLKRQAVDAYALARQLNGGYALNTNYISPQIVALLSNR